MPLRWAQSLISWGTRLISRFSLLSFSIVRDRRRGVVAIACIISIFGVLIQFFTPPHANEMLLVGKFINGFALGTPLHLLCIFRFLRSSIAVGLYISGAPGYCVEVSPLALRGITTAAVNFWLVGKFSLCILCFTASLTCLQLVNCEHPCISSHSFSLSTVLPIVSPTVPFAEPGTGQMPTHTNFHCE